MWDLKPFIVYTLCSQEKNYFFNVRFEILSYIYSMFIIKKLCFSKWDKKPFGLNTSILKDNIISFQCEIWIPLVYILYVHKKKVRSFQCEIKNFNFIIYNMYSLYSHGFFLNFFIWNTKWLDWKSKNQSENNKLNRWWILHTNFFYFSPLSFSVYRWLPLLVFKNSILM
jgi:hypothetical protein